MSAEKLSSEEVPHKFLEWLLKMGCPEEKIPSVEKIKQMCRGQYYMVWRSLIEQVQPKDLIQQKKLQVFCDDVKICEEKNAFSKVDSSAVVPEQLVLWKQHMDLKNNVGDAEARVGQARKKLEDLMNKTSGKLIQRNSSQRRLEDLQRRVYLLRQVANDLATKKSNLEETKSIASSLCAVPSEEDVQSKLNKYIMMCQRQSQCSSSSVASSSITSQHDLESEDNVESIVKCRADALWPLVYARRAAVVSELSAANTDPAADVRRDRITPKSVLAHTASLHSTIALEVMKNRLHIKQTRVRIAVAVQDLNNCLSGEACELLVLRCEKARAEARVRTLKCLLDELASQKGVFSTEQDSVDDDSSTTLKKIASIDKSIDSTRDELKRLITSLATTERKTQNMKDCLGVVFKAFQSAGSINDSIQGRGFQLDFPEESIGCLRQFYAERRPKTRNVADLSFDLDVTESSLNDTSDNSCPKFIDELKIYLKKFSLEKNRKLVMDSGETIWCFQTVQSSLSRLHSRWLSDDVTPLLCPSVCVSRSLQQMIDAVLYKDVLKKILREIGDKENSVLVLDIQPQIAQEEVIVDTIKKCIGENLIKLQKINKTLDLSQYNIQFWSDDHLKKHISSNRTVDGKTYKEYEAYYSEHLALKS